MRLRSLSGIGVVSMLVAGTLAGACGSSPDKKHLPPYDSGGEGGEGGGGGDASNTGAQAGKATTDGGNAATDGGNATTDGGNATQPGAGGTSTTGDGGAGGAAVTVPQFHGLYVGEDGLDTADGTADAPFSTLAHAASIAQAGDTIVFLDGAYPVGLAATIPDGVDLMAENSGGATLTATAGNLDLLQLSGSTRINGLKFTGYAHVATFPAGATATGTLTIEDSTFTNCVTACLDLTGAVEAKVSAATNAVVGNSGNAFALVSGTAKLELSGGILQNYGAAGIVRATDDATVTITDTQFLGGSGAALTLDKKTVAVMDGVVIATQSQGLVLQKGESKLTVKNADLSMQPAAPSVYQCFRLEMDGLGSLTVEDSNVHACNSGFTGTVPGKLTVTRTDVHDMPFGLDLGGGAFSPGGVVRLTDSKFRATQYAAFRIGIGAGILDLKVRGTLFSGPATGVTWHTIYLDGNGASTIDLGTGASPGGNTFQCANAAYSTLWIGNNLAALTTLASGNTWVPLAQGADAQGHYSSSATPGVLDSTSTVAGPNYAKTYGGTIRLAESL
jgi:hypothetical protein